MSESYSRVYWSVMSDEKFDGVREDPRLFGSWSLLLLIADMWWPAPAYLPPTVRRADVVRLIERGLIDELDGGRYLVHGLASERKKRSQSARNAAASRWQSDRNAEPMPSRVRVREEAEAERAPDDGRLDLEAFLLVRHRIPTPRQREFMDAYLKVFDVTGPQRAERVILSHPDDPIGALKADLEAFRAERRAALPAEPRRRVSGPNRTLLLAYHNGGEHVDDPDPDCPACKEAA